MFLAMLLPFSTSLAQDLPPEFLKLEKETTKLSKGEISPKTMGKLTNVDYVLVEDKIIETKTISRYKYGKTKGDLVVMFTNGKVFGLKYYPKGGETKYFSFVGSYLIELDTDIWSDIVVCQH